ncbi:MAG: hypothetical protein AB1767_10095 [Bacillota bacterium]
MKLRFLIQPLFEIEKHMALVPQTALILKNDGNKDIYDFLRRVDAASGKTGLALLAKGAGDADKPLSGGYIVTLWHFHHPWTHRGYLVGGSAADQVAWLFTHALNLWQNGKRGKALYQLGRALHLVQDIFIPHHAAVTASRGHGELEQWLTGHWEPYRVADGGYYQWETYFHDSQNRYHRVRAERPYDWIDHGSHLSIGWFDAFFAGGVYDEGTFRQAAALIIPHALRFSAGFLYRFFRAAEL